MRARPPVEPDKTPEEGYHFTEDLADRAIKWIRQQKALTADKPFFMYFAPGATHAPHHVPPEWSAKYKGKFDQGWDALREETFARQKELGVIPPDAELTARPEEIPAWDDMPGRSEAGARPPDGGLRRLPRAHRPSRRAADRRARRSRHPRGHARLLHHRRQRRERRGRPPRDLQRADQSQRRRRAADDRVHGRAHRQVRHAGGLQPLRGRLGARDGHAVPVDEADRLALGRHPQRHDRPLAEGHRGRGRGPQPVPSRHRRRADGPRSGRASRAHEGPRRRPEALQGVSMSYTFDDAGAAERHETQYFEMFCNRGIYHKGWTAVTRHSLPWVPEAPGPFDDDTWELYDTNTDWSQARDLAAEMPEKLAELQALFLEEAKKYNVLPLDDRRVERFNSDIAGRPTLITGQRRSSCSGAWGD